MNRKFISAPDLVWVRCSWGCGWVVGEGGGEVGLATVSTDRLQLTSAAQHYIGLHTWPVTTLDLMTPALVKPGLINSFVTHPVINRATMNAAFGICVATQEWGFLVAKNHHKSVLKLMKTKDFDSSFWSFIYRPHFLLIYFYLIPFSIHFTHGMVHGLVYCRLETLYCNCMTTT